MTTLLGPSGVPQAQTNSITGGNTNANPDEQRAPISEMNESNAGTFSATEYVTSTMSALKMSCEMIGYFNGPNFSSIGDHMIWMATNNCNGYVINKPNDTINFTVCASLKMKIAWNRVKNN